MTKFLLAVHVLAAILAVGPVAVAASMFPALARRAAEPDAAGGAPAGARITHRVCQVYALAGAAVPLFGFATASMLRVMGSPWLIASIALTAVAALVLGFMVLPGQERVLATLSEQGGAASLDRSATARLSMVTGVFNLLWAVVTVLMIVRPGSTTGV
ncbi:DUF2269 family protein [Streptantibioticus cattleyicolor]|uniref:Integral membrane protein n=1 Tax=Streptantibioticus cattleyicolor (strain ATCC 35852 / DSM 46488 / JCM 4925 / NBRC 14057 / NRRL 8057) TaxID=1003195 RepID=F8JMX6_STREN|nr:DUF2269 family protein [Streptantibioticus cattleyicolor]AEW98658.1 hypothetical protein SCATT_p04650 [Streptantibioticus cattleyicolor NRRL 8057 = DSM 46488]CCB72284.1 conserved membrane protein of unknown function [Streptantibioticus cattleyicolor NRRL 8057 = DSM 46488]